MPRPVVRADLPKGLSDETKETLRQAIKARWITTKARRHEEMSRAQTQSLFVLVSWCLSGEEFFILCGSRLPKPCGGQAAPRW